MPIPIGSANKPLHLPIAAGRRSDSLWRSQMNAGTLGRRRPGVRID
jgi:hypothetical protein